MKNLSSKSFAKESLFSKIVLCLTNTKKIIIKYYYYEQLF